MAGKYSTLVSYYVSKFRRSFITNTLRPLVAWTPQENPEPGYSVVIACNSHFRPILTANLMFLDRQDVTNLRTLFVVFERTAEEMGQDFERQTLERFPNLPIQFVYYSPKQAEASKKINWPWADSWMSWTTAIGLCKTRYLLLHDFDAFPIREDMLEDRYRAIQSSGDYFVGVKHYNGNGVLRTDELLTTWELILDVQYLRGHFRPIEMFSYHGRIGDRLIDFDTFLHAQTKIPQRSLSFVPATDLVHPSQVISQAAQALHGIQLAPRNGNLLIVPYFYYLAGEPQFLHETTAQLNSGSWPIIQFLGQPLNLSHQTRANAAWLRTQAERMEEFIVGTLRPEVGDYFDAMIRFASNNPAEPTPADLALEG